jgi:hypothetical protein
MRSYWRAGVSRWFPGRRLVCALHPGLDIKANFFRDPFLFFPLLCILRENGLVGEIAPFFPGPLGESAQAVADQPRVRTAIRETLDRPLAEQLRFHSYTHMNTMHDGDGRPSRIARAVGARQVVPYLLPRCLPFAVLPLKSERRDKRLYPGKELLRLAMRGKLPEEVLNLPKTNMSASNNPAWQAQIAERLEPKLRDSFVALRAAGEISFRPALWHALMIARPPAAEYPGL